MTVGELRELLRTYDADTEVRMATQPSYPQSYDIEYVEHYHPSPCKVEDGYCETHDDTDPCEAGRTGPLVYLTEGDHRGQIPGPVRYAVGW